MLNDYYYDFSLEMKKNFSRLIFDKDGIPKVDYGKKIGIQYNPVTIAQYSLAHLSLRMKNKIEEKIFLKCAGWFVRNASDYKNDSLVWLYKFDLTECGLEAPWISAIAQGMAISVLVRAYEITNDNNILKIVEKAINVFELASEEGCLVLRIGWFTLPGES